MSFHCTQDCPLMNECTEKLQEDVCPPCSKTPKIVIVLKGGLIDGVYADQAGVEYVKIDLDTDGLDEPQVLKDRDDTEVECFYDRDVAQYDDDWVSRVYRETLS